MAVSIDERFSIQSFLNRYFAIALLAMISLSFNIIFINKAMSQNGYWEVTLWMAVLTQLFLLVTLPSFIHEAKKVKLQQAGAVFAMSFALLIGTLTSNKSYADNVSISSAIISLPMSMIMAFLLSIFAPNLLEKHTLKIYAIRFTAAVVMILSALKLSL